MPREVELNKGGFFLAESEVEGFLERAVTPIGTLAKVDVPKIPWMKSLHSYN